MPEGDTIHNLATSMRPDLEARRVVDASLRERAGAEHLRGSVVSSVEALGKHLLIDVDSGFTLRVHLGMVGNWHRYAPGERWRRPQGEAKVVLATATHIFVCFQPPTVDLFPTRERPTHPVLSRLGPDLLRPPVPYDEVLRRARAPEGSAHTAADLLLDQRVAAGVGNVIKCEALFLEGVAPFVPAASLDDATVRRLFERGEALLRANLRPGPRVTTLGKEGARPWAKGSRSWVYDRARRPCWRCGEAIRSRKAGDLPRITWWCPRCQATSRA